MTDQEINRLVEWFKVYNFHLKKCDVIKEDLTKVVKSYTGDEKELEREMDVLFDIDEKNRLKLGYYYRKLMDRVNDVPGNFNLFKNLSKAIEEGNDELSNKIRNSIKYKFGK